MAWPKFNTTDFPSVSKETWTTKVLKDLKGNALESLYWDSEIGTLEPVYHPEDQIPTTNLPPRSIHNTDNAWEVTQSFRGGDSNKKVLTSLMQGASYLNLELKEDEEAQLETLLAGVHLEMIHLRIEGNLELNAVVNRLTKIHNERNLDQQKLKGCLGTDVLTSNFDLGKPATEEELIDSVSTQIDAVAKAFPSMRSLPVQANRFFEAGATNALELALALHIGNTYVNAAMKKGVSPDEITHLFEFKLAAGGSYFLNIAKFRAFRSMWKTVVESYAPEHACSSVTWVEAQSSERFYSSNDHYNNLLRATTSAMSAIVGSVDSLDVSNCSPSKQDEDELRYARNIQHLLREESWLDAVIDAGHGSYYIESITAKLIAKAGTMLEQIEEAGGIWTAEGMTFVEDEMLKNRTKILDDVSNENRWVIGVNKFASNETVAEQNGGKGGKLAPFNVPFELTKKG